MENRVFTVAKITIFGVVLFFVIGLVVQFLWNWLIPDLIGGTDISFLQAIGVLILCKILFGNTGSRAGARNKWRRDFKAKVEKMNAAERSELRDVLNASGDRDNPDAGTGSSHRTVADDEQRESGSSRPGNGKD